MAYFWATLYSSELTCSTQQRLIKMQYAMSRPGGQTQDAGARVMTNHE